MADDETSPPASEPASDTERIPAPSFRRGDERVHMLRSALASPDALQRLDAAFELDRIERLLLIEVVVAQRAFDEKPLDPNAALGLAVALRRLAGAGVLAGAAKAQVLEQAMKLLARSLAALGPPEPPPVLRMLIDTARTLGRDEVARRFERLLANRAATVPAEHTGEAP
ncbi:MAG: hypothetical protein D6776_05235 [Planctomycetota bacterium]|nr:MAG: hypothetical protein D6776_05235 [Planctomycetota bacterium]